MHLLLHPLAADREDPYVLSVNSLKGDGMGRSTHKQKIHTGGRAGMRYEVLNSCQEADLCI